MASSDDESTPANGDAQDSGAQDSGAQDGVAQGSRTPPSSMDDSAVASDAANPADASSDDDQPLDQSDIERLLDQATDSLEEITGGAADPDAAAQPFTFGDLQPTSGDAATQPIDLIGDVEMDLRIELGRTQMKLHEVLQLRSGSVVALDKLAGDPVDVFANGKLIARGEVLVMNDNFCIRITELVGA